MRILITGSREATKDLVRWGVFEATFDRGRTTLVHGGCKGADAFAAEYADEMGWKAEEYPADWDKHGKAAGPIRNSYMVSLGADLCLAFPTKGAKGTWDCIRKAADAGIPVRIYPG